MLAKNRSLCTCDHFVKIALRCLKLKNTLNQIIHYHHLDLFPTVSNQIMIRKEGLHSTVSDFTARLPVCMCNHQICGNSITHDPRITTFTNNEIEGKREEFDIVRGNTHHDRHNNFTSTRTLTDEHRPQPTAHQTSPAWHYVSKANPPQHIQR